MFPTRLAGLERGLRVNPVVVVEEKGKRRITHDSTFSGDPEGEEGGGGVSERDDLLGSDPVVPPGGRAAPDSMEDFGDKG